MVSAYKELARDTFLSTHASFESENVPPENERLYSHDKLTKPVLTTVSTDQNDAHPFTFFFLLILISGRTLQSKTTNEASEAIFAENCRTPTAAWCMSTLHDILIVIFYVL